MIATHNRGRRPAFTLIELMVVIFIVIVLATLALTLGSRLADNQRTSRGADQLQGWLLIAKQRAYRDKLPRGLRILPPASGAFANQFVYIERPDDFFGGMSRVEFTASPPAPVAGTTIVRLFNVDAAMNPSPLDVVTNGTVQAGDYFEYLQSPGSVHRIDQVLLAPSPQMPFAQAPWGAMTTTTLVLRSPVPGVSATN